MAKQYKWKSIAGREELKVLDLFQKYGVKKESQLTTTEQKAELKKIRDWGQERRVRDKERVRKRRLEAKLSPPEKKARKTNLEPIPQVVVSQVQASELKQKERSISQSKNSKPAKKGKRKDKYPITCEEIEWLQNTYYLMGRKNGYPN